MSTFGNRTIHIFHGQAHVGNKVGWLVGRLMDLARRTKENERDREKGHIKEDQNNGHRQQAARSVISDFLFNFSYWIAGGLGIPNCDFVFCAFFVDPFLSRCLIWLVCSYFL